MIDYSSVARAGLRPKGPEGWFFSGGPYSSRIKNLLFLGIQWNFKE